MLNITFQQMEAFLTVGTYANLSKAAEAMFISQSALSKMLQRFEEGLEVQLFVRSNQGLAFTDEGRFLYSKLSILYQNIDNTIKMAQNISVSQVKALHIVAPSSYDASGAFDTLRELVGSFQERYPHVVLHQTLYDFGELRRMLELGGSDLAFAQDFSIEDMPGISYKRISKFEICLAISANHRIAQDDELDFSLLNDEYFFTVPIPGSKTNLNDTLQRCRSLGLIPKGLEFVPNFQTLLHNIKLGRGVSICGRFCKLSYDDIKYYPLPEPESLAYVVVAWRNGKISQEAQDFIEMLPAGEVFVNE